MHILIALLGVAVGAGIWIWRLRIAAKATLDTASDIHAAVRRFGYRRKANVNPLDGVEDARLAAAGILAAFANMDEVVRRLGRNLETKLDATEKRQLLAMIERVAGVEGGGLSDSQRYALDSLARQLG